MTLKNLAAWSLFCVASMASVAYGQESRATLGGRVTDTQNAVVPHAAITVDSVETGVEEHTTTNNSGEWSVRALNPGHYTFTVTAPGFKTLNHQAIELQVGDQKTADVHLEVGAVSETVTVGAEAPLIDTSAAVSGTVITTKELEDLPTQSHVPTLLAGLTPGTVVGNGYGGAPHLWSNIGDSQVQANGSGSVAGSGAQNNQYSVQYTLDGSYDSVGSGQVAFVPPQDAISEFRMQTNAYDASIGRQSGATLNMVLKTGTKDFHGSLYEYHQDNSLNAYTWGSTNRQAVHYNEYGGTIGGPVWLPHLYNGRDRGTFFFFSYDGIRNNAPVNTGYMTLPTAAERNGDFSQSFVVTNGIKYPVTVYDPNTVDANGNRQAFASDQIPTNRISPFAKAILALMPLPDSPADTSISNNANNFAKNEVQRDKFSSDSIRVDQAWNNNNHSYASINFNNWGETSYDPFGGFANNILNAIVQARKQETLTLDHNVVLSPKLVLDLKYNVLNGYFNSYSPSKGYDVSKLGLSSTYIGQMPLESIPEIQGLVSGAENGGLGTAQAGSYTVDTFQTMDVALTQVFHRQTIKYGFEHLIQQEGAGGLNDAGGLFNFGGNAWTCQNPVANCTSNVGNGSNIANFLLGLPTSGSIPINATGFFSQHYTAAYIQDDWRLTPKFTLNLGLRWDYQTGVSERHNKAYTRYNTGYVQTAITSASQANYAATVGSPSSNSGVQLLQQYRANPGSLVTTGALEFSSANGTPRTRTNPRYTYFQPRLGFAYRLYPKTVLRGGLGRFVQADFIAPAQVGYSQSTGFVATSDNYYHPYTDPTTNTVATVSNPYPGGLLQPTGSSLGPLTSIGGGYGWGGYYDPDYGRIYVDEASASIQQEIEKFLIEIGGEYSRTHDLALNLPTNTIPTAAYLAAYSPQFDSTGRPVDVLPGDQPVANPFKGVAGLDPSSSIYTSKTLSASQLLRPNPVTNSDTPDTTSSGSATYYDLRTKVERRYSNGFSLLQSFTWARNFTQDFLLGNENIQIYIPRQIYSNDIRFHYTLTPIYELPFGHGKRFLGHVGRGMEQLVGGWEFTGIYNYQSGTPLVLPTNSSFYRGDRSPDTNVKRGRTGTYFDTTAFVPYPTKSTPAAVIHNSSKYPGWTGIESLPGYNWVPTNPKDSAQNGVYNDFTVRNTLYPQTFGDIRNPPVNTVTAGVRKNFNFTETFRLQLRMDATNLFNHPQFGNINTDPNNAYFGRLSGSSKLTAVNNPRQIELAAKIYF